MDFNRKHGKHTIQKAAAKHISNLSETGSVLNLGFVLVRCVSPHNIELNSH